MLDFINASDFSADIWAAMQAFANSVESDDSFEAFEAAQDHFYAVVGDHEQIMQAEMALGF